MELTNRGDINILRAYLRKRREKMIVRLVKTLMVLGIMAAIYSAGVWVATNLGVPHYEAVRVALYAWAFSVGAIFQVYFPQKAPF